MVKRKGRHRSKVRIQNECNDLAIDFEYLKFLNETIMKDDVLDQFMQRASEFETAAGVKATESPTKKR